MRIKLREDYNDDIFYMYSCFQEVPEDVVNVVMRDGIHRIEMYTFAECKWLNSIEIPNSVTHIGAWAFENCYSLKSIKIPDNASYIGRCAFAGCDSLEEVILPDSITAICDDAFKDCSNLTIYFNKGNEYLEKYCRENNIDYDYV